MNVAKMLPEIAEDGEYGLACRSIEGFVIRYSKNIAMLERKALWLGYGINYFKGGVRKMLKGLEVKVLNRFADERGFFTELFRSDWDGIIEEEIVQANHSISYPGMVRAWHRHLRGQVDCFVVLKGAMKICAYDGKEVDEIFATGENLQLVRIPGHYWHGFKVIGEERAYLVYFVNRLYDYGNPDEERRPWNDPTIVPERINGRNDDERCNKSWDWSYQPYK